MGRRAAFYSAVIILAAVALALVSCAGGYPPPAVHKSAPDDLQQTAAWDSYQRGAVATQQAREQEAAAIVHSMMATDQVATAQASLVAVTVAAQQTADARSYQATSTAAAIQATSTAQAWQVTATAEANRATSTAQAQATRAAGDATATTTAGVATAQAVNATATAVMVAAQSEVLKAEREAKLQPLKTWGPWALEIAGILLLAALGTWAIIKAMKAWDATHRVVQTGPFGRPLVVLDGPGGARVILDPARMFGPATMINGETVTMPALTDSDYQNQTTARSQAVELRQAAHAPFPALVMPQRARRHTHDSDRRQAEPWQVTQDDAKHYSQKLLPTGFPLPRWDLLDRWQGGGLPLGVGRGGLLTIDPAAHPHYLMAGTTGSGKTRYGLRPLITAALADGWQVAIFDRAGVDFLPFQHHPNCKVALLDDPTAAIGYLRALYDEVQRRFALLREAGANSWEYLPVGKVPANAGGGRPARTLAVFDEFSNLADAMGKKERDELWRGARMVAAEGRKAGVHLALALQDPTHKSIDLRIRRNATPIAFRVRDDAASRVILGAGGAETLAPRHFLAVLGNLVEAAAFAPTDGEIGAFLGRRPAASLAAPTWLDVAVGPLGAGAIEDEATPAGLQSSGDNLAGKIRELAGQGLSGNAIQRALFGTVGGSNYYRVKAALGQ